MTILEKLDVANTKIGQIVGKSLAEAEAILQPSGLPVRTFKVEGKSIIRPMILWVGVEVEIQDGKIVTARTKGV